MAAPTTNSPLIGITCDLQDGRVRVRPGYAASVIEAGGTPLLLPPIPRAAPHYARLCDAFILTGGDDPIMENFGVPTHAAATRVAPERQSFELALLEELGARYQAKPVLGVCLGMQYMALAAGGALDQHLPESTPTHADHYGDAVHAIELEEVTSALSEGQVCSHHRQAVSDAGRMRVLARSSDGLIEAIDDPTRPFFLGVQWHPERTEDERNGKALFRELVTRARDGD